jgi:hypothetical protein
MSYIVHSVYLNTVKKESKTFSNMTNKAKKYYVMQKLKYVILPGEIKLKYVVLPGEIKLKYVVLPGEIKLIMVFVEALLCSGVVFNPDPLKENIW